MSAPVASGGPAVPEEGGGTTVVPGKNGPAVPEEDGGPAVSGEGDGGAAPGEGPAAKAPRRMRAARWLEGAENFLASAFFVALAAVVFLQFFTRYVLNAPLGWTEETARYLLIVAAYFGCVVATRRDAHIRLELLEALAPPRAAAVARGLAGAALALLCAALAWLTLELIFRSRRAMTSMPWVSLKAVYWPVFLCFAAMSARAAAMLFRRLRAR